MPDTASASTCVALLIAAPASGQGKTTVTAALARWHARQGKRVRVFKCGPDFLDPHWLSLASGQPVHNIDGWMLGMPAVRHSLHRAATEADVLLVEGVMGLFDGSMMTAADLAADLGLPVLAVVDASAMAGSFGALVLGLQQYREDVPWAGVIANRVAHAAHAQSLRESLRHPALWLGAMPPLRLDAPTHTTPHATAPTHGNARLAAAALFPQRHLGLMAATEVSDALQRLDAAADALQATELGQLPWTQWQQRWSVTFAPVPEQQRPTLPPLLHGRTVAVARDAAFSFIYPANLQCLRDMGADLVFFSPLAGDDLPGCDALWLPGGYPELHAGPLAANTRLQASLRAHVGQGRAIWAECGGMLALCESITLADGSTHALWGLLPARAQMQTRPVGLGMQQCTVQGGVLRGHTFHYSRLQGELPVVAQTTRAAGPSRAGDAVYALGSIHASYFHAWFASHPQAAAALLGAQPVQWD